MKEIEAAQELQNVEGGIGPLPWWPDPCAFWQVCELEY